MRLYRSIVYACILLFGSLLVTAIGGDFAVARNAGSGNSTAATTATKTQTAPRSLTPSAVRPPLPQHKPPLATTKTIGPSKAELDRLKRVDPPIERVYPEAYLIPGYAARRAATTAAATAINNARTAVSVYKATRPGPPSTQMVNKFNKQLERDGPKSLDKSRTSLQAQTDAHMGKIKDARTKGGYTSSMEREVRTFKAEVKAIDLVKKKK